MTHSPAQLTSTCSNSTRETLKTGGKYVQRRHRRCSGVFVAHFEHVSHFFLVFLLLTLNNWILAWCIQAIFKLKAVLPYFIILQKCLDLCFSHVPLQCIVPRNSFTMDPSLPPENIIVLMFSGGRERVHCKQMGSKSPVKEFFSKSEQIPSFLGISSYSRTK